jgi:L-lactate dehydrogenase complex protein LldG
MNQDVLSKVRSALGRGAPLTAVPAPPQIDESITRLVAATDDLLTMFIRLCEENKMHVQRSSATDLATNLTQFLKQAGIKRAALSSGGLLERLSLAVALRLAGIDAQTWDQLSLDQVYDFDCGITNVDYAVAETGSLVVRASAGNGRALSLVPALHVAVVEKSKILADLIDLFAALDRDGSGSAVSIISGPSKTSDIEMNLVVGVHGPIQVQVFLVD